MHSQRWLRCYTSILLALPKLRFHCDWILLRVKGQYALAQRLTPQKSPRGQKVLLNTPQHKRLIEWTISSKRARETWWAYVPDLLGLEYGGKATRIAFKKQGCIRSLPRRKLVLSEQNGRDRVDWATEHLFWSDEQWNNVLWSDELWVQPGKHKKAFVIRKTGQEEVYHCNCIAGIYQKKIGWMFWLAISRAYSRERVSSGRLKWSILSIYHWQVLKEERSIKGFNFSCSYSWV